jgi:endonuclease G
MIISVDIWEQAAARWRERTTEREKKRAGTQEDSSTQRRVRRLTKAAAEDKARALALAAAAPGEPQATAFEVFAQERIIGKSDLLDASFLELAIAMARPVARIRLNGGFGTGFMVSPTLLLTNNHVLRDRQEAESAVAEFDYQENRSGDILPVQAFELLPERFFHTSVELDFTAVAVAPASARGTDLKTYGWVKLIAELGKADTGDCINIVQHPNGGLKQIALRENEVVDIFDNFLHYLTDTEPGSSGSPCFNDQWELVALHHSGVPKTDAAGRLLRDDGKIWRRGIDPPTRVVWVANEGIRVSSIVRNLQAAQLDAEGERLIDEMLAATPPNPIELARGATEGKLPEVPRVIPSANSVTWTIPIEITISVGGAAAAPPAKVAVAAASATGTSVTLPAREAEEKITIDPNYANRSGYQEDFIPDFRIALPQMSDAVKANAVVNPKGNGARRYALDYQHFSIVMNKRRRLAYYTAVNIDGKQKQTIKREADAWFFDPRIDRKFQIGEEAYVANLLDRGHLVRRLDPAWGATASVARKANNDTFHFTNCSPQHMAFNQGGDLWQGLEDYLLNKAKNDSRRMTVFTGPIFRAGDPAFKGQRMDKPIRLPVDYWKVAALVKDDDTKVAAAFIVSQSDLIGDATDLEERFEPQLFQVPIVDVEKLTGLKFGSLREFDTVDDGTALERFEAIDAGARALSSFEDVRI